MYVCIRYHEEGGFSTLAITDYNIDMAEILARVIRKRCLQVHGAKWVGESVGGS